MAINFKEGRWNHEINVTDFVKTKATPPFWQVRPNVRKQYGTNVWKPWLKNVQTTEYAH